MNAITQSLLSESGGRITSNNTSKVILVPFIIIARFQGKVNHSNTLRVTVTETVTVTEREIDERRD
jgi:hypothetical protein